MKCRKMWLLGLPCLQKYSFSGWVDISFGLQSLYCFSLPNHCLFCAPALILVLHIFSSDPRFPENGKVEFVFGNNSEGLVQGKFAEADQESSTNYFLATLVLTPGTKLFDNETIPDRIF